MSNLKTILKNIRKELKEKDAIRETAHAAMRKATSLSKQSILLIHQRRNREAKKLIEEAKAIIAKLGEMAAEYPHIIYSGMLDAAHQEYAEANVFLHLIEEREFLTPKEVGVPSVDYVLGLADVIGEFRRVALDALREDNVKKGEECLQIMDDIYVELMALDDAYMLVSGLRRKCDVARKIIEITRGDITQEVRRNALEKHLELFEKQAKARKRSSGKA
jgi:translin